MTSRKVYVTNVCLHKGEPVLLGIEVGEGGESLGRICVQVKNFEWDLYVEPGSYIDDSDEDELLKWDKQVLAAYEEYKQHSDSSTHAGKELTDRVSKHYRRRKLCGVSKVRSMARFIVRRSTEIKGLATALAKAGSVYFHDVDPVLSFLHISGVRCFSYVRLEESRPTEGHKVISRCEVEVSAEARKIQIDPDINVPHIRVVSFDLETDGLEPEKHEIRMISAHACDFPFSTGGRPPVSVLFTRHTLAGEPGAPYRVEECNSEKKMIQRFAEFVDEQQTLVLTGWNTAGFDLTFIAKRLDPPRGTKRGNNGHSPKQQSTPLRELAALSWLKRGVHARSKTLQSAAYGINNMMILSVAGLICMDGLILARKQLKLINYSLRTVAEWAGHQKGDVTYEEMVDAFTTEDPHKLRAVANYCMKDAEIVIPILNRMEEPVKVFAVSTMAAVPPDYVVQRGMQILTWSLILDEARRQDMVPNKFPPAEQHEYEGATVIPPRAGYYPDVVCVLDFKSLYPSCMLADNICLSTKVCTSLDTPDLRAKRPYPQYAVVEIGGGKVVVFDRKTFRGVIPTVLEKLLRTRQDVKRQMKLCEKGSVREKQLDARQIAVKVLANSEYGFLGSRTNPAGEQSVDIAASVTSLGRKALQLTRSEITKLRGQGKIPEGTEIVYGDSVTGDTPLVVRRCGIISTCRIDELVTDSGAWQPTEDGKWTVEMPGVEVWSDTGFTAVRRVIRHRCNKEIMRVVTGTGLVDCTTDHSLLRIDGTEIRPVDANAGQDLLHAHDRILMKLIAGPPAGTPAEEQAWVCGLFLCRGEWPWRITHHCIGTLKHAAACVSFPTVIDGHTLRATSAATPLRGLSYNAAGEKRVPPEILCAPLREVMQFWRGFQSGAGVSPYLGKEALCGLWLVARRLGFKPSLVGGPAIQMTLATTQAPHAVQSITSRGKHAEDVYDLETSDHHFHVGPGNLVVHNTDSVMVWFPGSSVEVAEEAAKFISDHVTGVFEKPMELEFETTLRPCLFLTKKRYAGFSTENKMVIKGIATQRRDYPKVVQQALQVVLEGLLKSTDGKGAERALRSVDEVLHAIATRQVPLEDLAITKEINKLDYKSLPPHVIVANKMKERCPDRAPKAGDRVQFVVVRGVGLKQKVADRSEDIEYVREKGLMADLGYYAELAGNQVMDLFEKANLKEEASRIIEPRIEQARRNTGLARSIGQTALPWAQCGVRVTESRPPSEPLGAKRTQATLPWAKAPCVDNKKKPQQKAIATVSNQRSISSFFGKAA